MRLRNPHESAGWPRLSSIVHHLSVSLVLGLLVRGIDARGQNVLTPPPPVNTTPPALQEFRVTESGETPPEESLGLSSVRLPLQWGPVTLRPHFLYSLSYANGLLASPGDPEATIINQFSPGITFVIGSHWTLDYTPSWQWYSNNKFQDNVGQNVALNGWAAYEDWIFGLSQVYRLFNAPTVQTGSQTEQESFATGLTASYRFNSKVSMDLALNQDFESAQQLESYNQWSTMDYVNYQFWPRFNAGLGLGGGYVNMNTGSDMTFEQFQGRIAWNATGKSSLVLHGGLEYRQFVSGGVSPMLNPVFGLALQTQITKKTSLSLSADQGLSASYFENQVSESTGVSVTLAQKLSGKLALSVSGSYGTVTYTSSATGVAPIGNYDYTYFTTRLTYSITPRARLSATYQFSDNNSTQPGLSFTANQVGLELSYSF